MFEAVISVRARKYEVAIVRWDIDIVTYLTAQHDWAGEILMAYGTCIAGLVQVIFRRRGTIYLYMNIRE